MNRVNNGVNVFHVVYRLVASRNSFITILLPSIIYLLTYQYLGLTAAVVATSVYGLLTILLSKEMGLIALAFALSGVIELTIVAYVPQDLLVEAVMFKLALSSLSTASVFFIFALLRKPIPMLVAEATTPKLKQSRVNLGIPNITTWQRVNGVWILSYLGKTLFLLNTGSVSESELVKFTLILGWPLHIGLIILSVWYINMSSKQATLPQPIKEQHKNADGKKEKSQ